MKIKCLHGFYLIEETRPGQVADFMNIFACELLPFRNFFTFSALASAPNYALVGGTYLEAPVIQTFEGEPWEIMKANDLVYDFQADAVRPLAGTTQRISLFKGPGSFVSSGLILPGSVTEDGKRVTDYSAHLSFDSLKFKYTGVTLV